MAKKAGLLITCEHATNHLPGEYCFLFPDLSVLSTHKGYDPGALSAAEAFARSLRVPLISSEVTRLLLDLNRSLHNRTLFSVYSRGLTREKRSALLDRYYHPYRARVLEEMNKIQNEGRPVLHLSVHSFTPVLGGEVRTADLGLLYDPARESEKILCLRWQSELKILNPLLRIRRNYPYRGRSDGLTAYFRKSFHQKEYQGVELEINQSLLGDQNHFPEEIKGILIRTLENLLK